MALGILAVLSLSTVTVIEFSTHNSGNASRSSADQTAYALAEAGIANAFSVLNQAVDPKTSTLLDSNTSLAGIQPFTVTIEGGTVEYSGTYNSPTYTWTISAKGIVRNPTGVSASAVTRKLTRAATVVGLNSGATVGAWSRMYHDSTTTCMTIEDVTIPTPIASRGDICLKGSGKITGDQTTVEVGDDVFMTRTTSTAVRPAGTGAGTTWTTPTNVGSSNNARATYSVPANLQSTNLDATGFGFAIPATANIIGVEVTIERNASLASALKDDDVYLLKAGAQAGTDHASATYWPTTDTDRNYGTTSDLWGTTWTPAQINASNFGVRLKVDSDNGSARTASVDYIEVTVTYQPILTASIGTVATPILQAHIFDRCQYDAQTANKPCTNTDKVYAVTNDAVPTGLSKPGIDMAFWYQNAQPGPMHNCTVGSFPGGFDNNSTYNNSLTGSAEVTPTGSSYTCQVLDAGSNLVGELSWNHVTHVLKITGTIFVDGDFRFDDDGQIVHYQGRGIIYAAGDIEFDELVCAGGTGTTSCVTGGMANWDPSQNMMTVLAGGWSEFDQGGTQAQSTPSGLQGIIYAVGDCMVHENFHLSGPIICNVVDLPSAPNGWPTYYTWPPLGSLVAGQAYSSADNAADYMIVPGAQTG